MARLAVAVQRRQPAALPHRDRESLVFTAPTTKPSSNAALKGKGKGSGCGRGRGRGKSWEQDPDAAALQCLLLRLR